MQGAAFDAVEGADGVLEGDLGLEFVDAGGLEVVLSFEDAAAGGLAGVKLGFFEFVLLLAEFGGEGGDADALEIGLDGADGGADLELDVLLDLLEAGLLAVEGGEALAVAGAVGGLAPGVAEGEVHLPGVALAVEGVAEGILAAAVGAVEAEGGANAEGGLGAVLGDLEVEFELFDGGLGGEEVGLVLFCHLVGGGEDGGGDGGVGETDGAEGLVELELADEGEEGFLAVLDGLFGEEDVAAGVGDADLGAEDVEVGGDAGVAADLGLVEETLGEGEGEVADGELFAGEGEVVVGVFGVLDDGEGGGLVVEVGAVEADLGALDGGGVDLGAEAVEEVLADGEGEVGVVGGVLRLRRLLALRVVPV